MRPGCPESLFCHDNSRRDWHVNVHDNVNVFGLGGIDLLRCCCCCCGRARTETCYCQYIHNMLLWACKKYCCCKYIIHEINPPTAYMNHLVADLYRWSWGRWRVSEARCKLLQQALVIYVNVEQRAHWLPIQERTNLLCHVIMMSLGQIELDLSDCAILSFMPELCMCPLLSYLWWVPESRCDVYGRSSLHRLLHHSSGLCTSSNFD